MCCNTIVSLNRFVALFYFEIHQLRSISIWIGERSHTLKAARAARLGVFPFHAAFPDPKKKSGRPKPPAWFEIALVYMKGDIGAGAASGFVRRFVAAFLRAVLRLVVRFLAVAFLAVRFLAARFLGALRTLRATFLAVRRTFLPTFRATRRRLRAVFLTVRRTLRAIFRPVRRTFLATFRATLFAALLRVRFLAATIVLQPPPPPGALGYFDYFL